MLTEKVAQMLPQSGVHSTDRLVCLVRAQLRPPESPPLLGLIFDIKNSPRFIFKRNLGGCQVWVKHLPCQCEGRCCSRMESGDRRIPRSSQVGQPDPHSAAEANRPCLQKMEGEDQQLRWLSDLHVCCGMCRHTHIHTPHTTHTHTHLLYMHTLPPAHQGNLGSSESKGPLSDSNTD